MEPAGRYMAGMEQRRRWIDPLDAALDYLRWRGGQVVPMYVAAMVPMAVAVMVGIDQVTAGHRSSQWVVAWLVCGALLWRWVGLAVVQGRVQEDVRGGSVGRPWRRLGAVLWARLACLVMMTWGSVLVVPAFYGWFVSALAGPALLEREGSAWGVLSQTFGQVNRSAGRLCRLVGVLGLLGGALCVVGFGTLYLVVEILGPALAGLERGAARLTLSSYGAKMAVFFGLWVLLDLYWTVASVMVFYDLQARRLGSDLRQRLAVVRGGSEEVGR